MREQLTEVGRATIADGVTELRVSVPSGRDVVRVEVDDLRPRGRGLTLVESISAQWG